MFVWAPTSALRLFYFCRGRHNSCRHRDRNNIGGNWYALIIAIILSCSYLCNFNSLRSVSTDRHLLGFLASIRIHRFRNGCSSNFWITITGRCSRSCSSPLWLRLFRRSLYRMMRQHNEGYRPQQPPYCGHNANHAAPIDRAVIGQLLPIPTKLRSEHDQRHELSREAAYADAAHHHPGAAIVPLTADGVKADGRAAAAYGRADGEDPGRIDDGR
mmetsp:Transcript_31780/g.64685  ORF Transcript_31780/g.64685 Transcript_31780/m.64685 type:complete len:215 (-) Transcript_31780:457-1101(-)